MSKVELKINHSAVASLLRGSEMQSACERVAQGIATRASSIGEGQYSANVIAGRNRAHAIAFTDSLEARLDNTRNNTLLKSMEGGSL